MESLTIASTNTLRTSFLFVFTTSLRSSQISGPSEFLSSFQCLQVRISVFAESMLRVHGALLIYHSHLRAIDSCSGCSESLSISYWFEHLHIIQLLVQNISILKILKIIEVHVLIPHILKTKRYSCGICKELIPAPNQMKIGIKPKRFSLHFRLYSIYHDFCNSMQFCAEHFYSIELTSFAGWVELACHFGLIGFDPAFSWNRGSRSWVNWSLGRTQKTPLI